MRKRLLAFAACLALGASITSPGTASASSELPAITDPPPFGCVESDPDPSHNRFTACTNDPTGRTAPDAVVVDELTRLVNRTDAGDTIRFSMYQWWYRTTSKPSFDYSRLSALTHALIDAANERGVDVRILIDNISDPAYNPKLNVPGTTQPYTELTEALGSRVHVCHRDGDTTYPSDCLDGGNGNAINHWQGWSSGSSREQVGGVVPYAGRVLTKGYVFPRAKYQDPFLDVLDGITACPDAYNRKVWISMSGVTLQRLDANNGALRDRFAELSGMGCAVKLLVDDSVDSTVRSALRGTGAEVVVANSLHHKFMVFDATSRGLDGEAAAPREFVWTGAMNLSWSSAWRDGEATVWVEHHEITRAYVSHFTCGWNRNRVDGGDDDSTC